MNINAINSVRPSFYCRTNNLRNSNYKYNSKPYTDTVSFTGLRLASLNSNNVRDAYTLGLNIYRTGADFGNVSHIIKSEIPEITVLSTDELPTNIVGNGRYDAFFIYGLDENLDISALTMYISNEPKDNNQISKLMYACDAAHEYTHARQVVSGEERKFLSKLTNGNVLYARTMAPVCDLIFETFDGKVKSGVCFPSLDNADRENVLKYGAIVPEERQIQKDKLLKNAGFRNEAEFKASMKKVFEKNFKDTVRYILKRPNNVDTEIVDQIIDVLRQKNGEKKLMGDFMNYCAHSAKREAEAYTTESKLAKKVLNTNKSLNIDTFPLYYEMLAKALS